MTFCLDLQALHAQMRSELHISCLSGNDTYDKLSLALSCQLCVAAGIAGANDERMANLMRAMNRLLDKHPQSRRRHLSWHTPAIVPVWPQVRHACSATAVSSERRGRPAVKSSKAH